MRQWGWSRTSPESPGRKSLPTWLRALSAAVPWITMLILFLTISKIGGTFFLDRGTLIDLPDGVGDISRCHAVAYVSHTDEGVLVFFDDTTEDVIGAGHGQKEKRRPLPFLAEEKNGADKSLLRLS